MRSTAVLALIFLAALLLHPIRCEDLFEPAILIYTGRMHEFGEVLREIAAGTGTRAILARSNAAFGGLLNLPQIGCVVIAAFDQADLAFLDEISPVLVQNFKEGGSYVGIGPVCNALTIEPLATNIFPVNGTATGLGKRADGIFGNTYVLSDPIGLISDGLPDSFIITQSQYSYRAEAGGPVESHSPLGDLKVVYREEETNTPMVLALSREGGGRSVSLTGCYVAEIERLPFHWGKLVDQEEFRLLLRGAIAWAMQGSTRHDELMERAETDVKGEAERVEMIRLEAKEARDRLRTRRILALGGLWAVVLISDVLLVAKYLVPRMRHDD